jgi:hypothetical protein
LAWQAEVTEHSGKVDRARHMEKKMTEAFRKRVQATQGVVTAEEEDIKLQGFKESVNELLSAILSTVEDNPELKGKVCVRVCMIPPAPLSGDPIIQFMYVEQQPTRCLRMPQVLDALTQAGISAPSRPLSANVSEHGSDAGSVKSAGSQGSQRSGTTL